ncbi:unnamed protein product [Ranitomeya imitator]|uniref:Cytochrome P450 n=1 Tax=Ranitomeya imitator TaxID=111125 RepID=A0ABN9MGK9_9NEOB|nr:unnamed protein product [Ranitomeya imitator]
MGTKLEDYKMKPVSEKKQQGYSFVLCQKPVGFSTGREQTATCSLVREPYEKRYRSLIDRTTKPSDCRQPRKRFAPNELVLPASFRSREWALRTTLPTENLHGLTRPLSHLGHFACILGMGDGGTPRTFLDGPQLDPAGVTEKTFAMELISLLISLAVILFLANVFKNHRKYANFPPGPKSLPLIGNMHIINTRKPQKSFMEISKTYGSVFSVQLGTERFVILCGYDAVKDALINHAEEFAGRPVTAMGSRTSQGYGILFANGENWKVMRRFTLSTLRDYGMGKKSIEDKIIEECECLMQKFKSYGGKPFDNLSVINAAVANIIVFILLDHRYEYDDPTILKLMNLINENVRIVGSVMIRLYNSFPSLIGWLPGKHNTIFENHNKMQNFVQDTFTIKEKELDINNQRNLIDAFLAKQQEGKPESNYHIKMGMLVSNLFAAGMENLNHSEWEKVQCEIENVIGSAQPQVEHRKEMPYTDAVIHEIQRFGDIVPGSLPHSTTKDITFRGYFLPKGTTVIPLLHSVLKDKAYFEKPEEFYPEHFLDSDGKFKRNEAFVREAVLERIWQKWEMFLFFTTLLQNFTFQAPPGAKLDLNPAPGLTNAPLPHEICAIPRR